MPVHYSPDWLFDWHLSPDTDKRELTMTLRVHPMHNSVQVKYVLRPNYVIDGFKEETENHENGWAKCVWVTLTEKEYGCQRMIETQWCFTLDGDVRKRSRRYQR